MQNNLYCIDENSKFTINETSELLRDDSSFNNILCDEKSNANSISISEIEEFMIEKNLCYDDSHYEICSISNIDYKIENDNIKEIKNTFQYNDKTNEYDINKQLQYEIREYASRINHKDFYENGTINDYSKLFESVSNMANEYKQIDLQFEINGFNEFSNTADQIINLFESFSKKLQNINIINDTTFLISISNALEKMCKLSESFIMFKKTILTISDVQIPKTVYNTTQILSNVMVDITSAINYICNFIDPSNNKVLNSELKKEDKIAIENAINIINNMKSNIECSDIKNKLERDEVFKSITRYNNSIKKSSDILKNATFIFKNKINNYNFN
jgi:hypothetical protein